MVLQYKFVLTQLEMAQTVPSCIAEVGSAWFAVMDTAVVSMGSKEMQLDGGHSGEVYHMQIVLGSVVSTGVVTAAQAVLGIDELGY